MSEDNKNETEEAPESQDAEAEAAPEQQKSKASGPDFSEPPGDPLAGAKKTADSVMASMEGKTVSMKVYVGTIIGIVVLMLLARCGD